ncbi:CRTAC1 family protein [Schlesneria sp. T3-172]|uniref:CRTAC1 family protein n=1 Tax=Schlesneria sphaerica TaxID=3373610 RepID=UPI0037CA569F
MSKPRRQAHVPDAGLISCPARVILMIITALVSGCDKSPKSAAPVEVTSTPALPVRVRVSQNLPLDRLRRIESVSSDLGRIRFASVAASTGLEFTYSNGNEGRRLMSEGTGGGCGWLDFDRDGNWDLYLGQGGVADADTTDDQPSDVLYRNVDGRFVDVSLAAGIVEKRYGQGVAIGDLDNDGFDDVFVTNIGGNVMWHNQGDGSFRVLSDWSEVEWQGWSTTAAWADLDLDGDLDLYVCNYCDFSPRNPVICRNAGGKPVQCQPNQVDPVADHYFENLGDGRFRECAQDRGLAGPGNRALGVVVADFTGDERPELIVANDATANFLFVEQQPGKYVDLASRFGCALDANGRAQANMGIAIGDYDRNGLLDIYITHFEGEWNTLYANDGESGFHDASAETNGIEVTLPWVGFGVVWQDFDLDGDDELFIANGHIDDLGRARVVAMPPQLLTFDGQHWNDVSADSGEYFGQLQVGRAAAEADFDGDGDMDIAVIHQNTPMELLENQSRSGHWLAVEFTGRKVNRRGIGARVTLKQNGKTLVQELAGGVGYCSSRQPRLVFGLGESTSPCDLLIRWPGGMLQELRVDNVDQLVTIIEPQAGGSTLTAGSTSE